MEVVRGHGRLLPLGAVKPQAVHRGSHIEVWRAPILEHKTEKCIVKETMAYELLTATALALNPLQCGLVQIQAVALEQSLVNLRLALHLMCAATHWLRCEPFRAVAQELVRLSEWMEILAHLRALQELYTGRVQMALTRHPENSVSLLQEPRSKTPIVVNFARLEDGRSRFYLSKTILTITQADTCALFARTKVTAFRWECR